MNNLETSLCGSCDHRINCSLTDDKEFIWSCTEYEAYDYQDESFHEKL